MHVFTQKMIIILIFALLLGFCLGYIISDFKMNKYIFGYDFYTLANIYIQIDSIVELSENEGYEDVKLKAYESNFHTLARYCQLSPQISGLSYSLSKIADMCNNDITPEEKKYLKDIRAGLKEYINTINYEFDGNNFIKEKLGINKKINVNDLKQIFDETMTAE